MLLRYDGVNGDFVRVRPFADNESVPARHYKDLIVADRLFYYERDGFDLYDRTISVFDDSLDLVWEAPFIPDRTELVPSYWAESRSIDVSDEYITVVGAEGFDHGIPDFLNRVNHLYCTRYTLDGDLVWHRKFDLLDSLLPNFWVADIVIDDADFIYAYGYYKFRIPAACDTCPITRNTFLLKLDSDGYIDGPPTNVEEEVAASSVTIYPNPSTGRATLDFGRNRSGHIIVRDITGMVVLTQKFTDQLNTGLILNKAGLYLVQVDYTDGSVETIKHIVTR